MCGVVLVVGCSLCVVGHPRAAIFFFSVDIRGNRRGIPGARSELWAGVCFS